MVALSTSQSEFMERMKSMNDLKELVKLYKEHPMLIVITLISMVIGAILGAVAFYNGWLG